MSEETTYPARNPFPHQGTLRLAGQRLDGAIPRLTEGLRSIDRTPIRKLKRSLADFLSRFQPEWSGDGGAAFVRGSHGSGKTHAIFAAWKSLPTEDRAFSIYVVLQGDDFLDLYRQLTGRLSLALLVELSRGLLANMTVEQLSETIPLSQTSVEVSQEEAKVLRGDLKADPLLVKRLFSSYAVEEGATRARQRGTLEDLTQGNSDLNRAVQCLQGEQFPSYAADWFCLRPVPSEKLQAMGIATPIRSAQQAAAAIELLAALFTAAGRPLVLFVDQCEKLLEGEPSTTLTNAGLLRSLMESFEARNAALVLSGTPAGWDGLPEDARQRIGLSVIDCELLSWEEALDLVRLNVIPVEKEFRSGSGSLYPFTEDAVREIVRLSAGNPRKLLQYCHIVFRHAQPSRSVIDLHLVSSTAKSELARQFFDKARVVQETRRILTRQPYRIAERFAIQDMVFDFALIEASKAIVLVNVTDAIYGDDEVTNALVTADTVGRLRTLSEFATFVQVATGYVSPEITERLRQAVNELIVFAPEEFQSQLESVLERALLHRPSPSNTEELSVTDRTIVKDALLQIGMQRANETKVVQQREEQVSETHAQRRYAERRGAARIEWSERRPRLEASIAEARKARAEAERTAFDKERKSANKLRWILDSIAFFATVILGSVMAQVLTNPGRAEDQRTLMPILLSFVLPFLFVLISDLTLLIFHSRMFLDVLSDSDLLQLRKPTFPQMLFSWTQTPAMRFAVNARRIERGLMSDRDLSQFLKYEPLGTLRLAYARLLSDQKRPFKEIKDTVTAASEGAILAENRTIADELDESAPAPFHLLPALYGAPKKSGRLSYDLCVVARHGAFPSTDPLALAFERGLDRANLSQLSHLSERQIRFALQDLSPFDKRGLGTFDFLRKIQDVDQAFLLCSQLLLYLERDLLIPQNDDERV